MDPPTRHDPRPAELARRAQRMRIDAATAELLGALTGAGVGACALKGATFARWLYPDDPDARIYVDCDVLVEPAGQDRAATLLERLGYARHFDDRRMPAWWREHASTWYRRRDGTTVDLHRTLPGVRARDPETWGVVCRHLEPFPVAGTAVPALDEPARALHVVLHAAHHGLGAPGPAEDLRRAIVRCTPGAWSQASRIASALGGTDAFTVGLRLTVEGAAIADALGLPPEGSARARLQASAPPAGVRTLQLLSQTPGARAKAQIVWRKLVPPREFVEYWDPRAQASRRALARAYLRRPVWVAATAVRAWRDR